MKKSKSFVLAIAAILTFTISTSSMAEYVMVTANNVNVRAGAYSSANVVGKASKNEVYRVFHGNYGDWTSILYPYWDEATFTMDSREAFITSQYLKPFTESPITRAVIGHTFRAVGHDSEYDGYLNMTFADANTVTITYRLVNPEWQRGGGSGTLDFASFEARYNGSQLTPEGDHGVIIYDAGKGLLYCNDISWEW